MMITVVLTWANPKAESGQRLDGCYAICWTVLPILHMKKLRLSGMASEGQKWDGNLSVAKR